LKHAKKATIKSGTKAEKSVYKRVQIKKSEKKKRRNKTTTTAILKRKRSVDGSGNYKIVRGKTTNPKKWVIYSLNGCPYCEKAKELLRERNIGYDYIEFDSLDDQKKKAITQEIDKVKPGFRTYPRIFNGTKFIGGYSDLSQSLI
jgi:glutaredoxin